MIQRTLPSEVDRLIAISLFLTIGGTGLAAWLVKPGLFGITALVVMTGLVVGWVVTKDARLGWLLPFGLVVGVLELWSDWIHVAYLRTLVYTDYFGFRLLASPSYMPIGWWLTSVQFGYIALRLSGRWPRWKASAIVALLGSGIPPWYEEFAAPAKAWNYTTSGLMLGHTPLWIILTYGGCMLSIALAALEFYRPGHWLRAVMAGFFAAGGIMFSAVFWFSLLG